MIHQMQCGPVRCGFADNGMVSEIILPEEFGSCNLLNGSSSLTLTLADGRIFTPVSGSGNRNAGTVPTARKFWISVH